MWNWQRLLRVEKSSYLGGIRGWSMVGWINVVKDTISRLVTGQRFIIFRSDYIIILQILDLSQLYLICKETSKLYISCKELSKLYLLCNCMINQLIMCKGYYEILMMIYVKLFQTFTGMLQRFYLANLGIISFWYCIYC